MFGGFSATKLKPQLKMAVSRIQIASNKKAALLKQNMREVAVMLAEDPPKEEKAKIRAEALIRDDNLIEAYEILQLQCELLHERLKLLDYSKDCPQDLVPVVSTLIWASQRVDIPELTLIRKQFRAKYGKSFEENAMANVGGVLNERVVTKLSVDPPAAYLVQVYLERICEQFEVNWKPKYALSASQMAEPMAPPVGYSVAVAQGTGLGPAINTMPYAIADASTVSDEDLKRNGGMPPPMYLAATVVSPSANGPSAASSVTGPANGADDFYEPDIFIPGPPTVAPGHKPAPPTNNNKDDDDDDHHSLPPPTAPTSGGGAGTPGAGGGTDLSASFVDLAARFDRLKK